MDKAKAKELLTRFFNRFALRPSILEIVLAVICLLAVVYYISMLAYIFIIQAFLGGVLLTFLWLLHGLVALFAWKKVRKQTGRQRAMWAVLPVAIILALVAVKGRYKLVGARIWLGENALQEFVESMPEEKDRIDFEGTQRIGLFWIRDVKRDGCIRMKVDSAGFIGPAGIVYSPDKEPAEHSDYYPFSFDYTHLYGPWYAWE